MDLISLAIPHDFIAAKTTLTWREVQFGIENQLLALDAPVEMAAALLATEADPGPVVLELGCLDRGESVRPCVDKLAQAEAPEALEEIKSKWLYLVLAWIFEHRASYDSPLQTVEMVYADFGYPEEIAGFVAYMPAQEPDLGSRERNEERLYEKWAAWLAERAATYAVR